jgi:hypothetical protein
MNSSCHFSFNYLGMPTLWNLTQSSNSNSLITLAANRFLLHTLGSDPMEDIIFYCWSVFTKPLHSNGHCAAPKKTQPLYCWRVFTQPFLSNGYLRHIMLIICWLDITLIQLPFDVKTLVCSPLQYCLRILDVDCIGSPFSLFLPVMILQFLQRTLVPVLLHKVLILIFYNIKRCFHSFHLFYSLRNQRWTHCISYVCHHYLTIPLPYMQP